jgi:hypothetical protein
VAVKLVYAYALLLLFAFAAALVALYLYVVHDYYGAAVSALTAGAAYLATRVVLFLITRRE